MSKSALTLITASFALVACSSGSITPVPAGPPGIVTIDFPVNGAVVCSYQPTVQVAGHAPPGSRIVQDISLAPDQDTQAGSDGRWQMWVDLSEALGDNDLVFRIGDFKETAVHLHVGWIRLGSAVMPDDCSPAIGGTSSIAQPTPSALPQPSGPSARPTSRATEKGLPLKLSGPASPQGESTERTIALMGGDYVLRWEVRGPFDPTAGYCGVTIYLYDATGEYAGNVEGVTKIAPSPTTGSVAYPGLPAGRYLVSAYVGCPWSLTLDRA